MSQIEVALFEHLPRLQCVNVHIQYVQRGDDDNDDDDDDDATSTTDSERSAAATSAPARFAINNARIEIGASAFVELPRCLYINAATMSRFVHTPGHISFRVCTDRANTFDEELLCRVLPSAMRLKQPPHAQPPLQPSVVRAQRLQLRCVDCREPLSEYFAFERVLPLPSDNLDADEWFCHRHHDGAGHGHDADAAEAAAADAAAAAAAACGELDADADADAATAAARSNAGKINARPLDLLYGQYCFVLHHFRLMNTTVRQQRYVYCACGAELGEYYRHTGTVKLWNETVCYTPHQLANVKLLGRHGVPQNGPPTLHMFAGIAYDHFVSILRKVIEDFDLLMSSVAMPQTIRCLFSSHTAAVGAADEVAGDTLSESTVKRSFLFVQVMNAEVDVWRYRADEDVDFVDGAAQTVALQRKTYIKIMYCMVEVAGTVPPPPLVASWQSDATVNCVGLCDRMLQEAMLRIVDNAELLPEYYRRQATGGFRMSYLW